MKDNHLLENKMEENDTAISESRWKKWAGIVGALVATGASYTAAFAIHALAPQFTIPLVLFGTYFPLAGVAYFEEKSDVIQESQKRNKHLDKIQREGVAKSKELDKRRTLQIAALEDKKDEMLRKMDTNAAFATLGTCAWIGGTVASLFVQPAMWAAIGGLFISSLALNSYANHEKKYMQYDTRVENITNDLVIGPVYDKESRAKSLDSTYSIGKVKAIVNPKYEKAIDDYVEELGNVEEDSIPKEKIKK